MSILDQYKKAIEEENENMDFPTDTTLSEKDREAYETILNKARHGYSTDEVNEAINNSKKNMAELGDEHVGDKNERAINVQLERVTDDELLSKDLLKKCEISDIKVIRAYCPKCGKELISRTPALYNPFTMQKVCKHDCSCGAKYNLDNTYPRIAYYDENGDEIKAYGL